MLSGWTVAWLLIAVAVLVFGMGLLVRSYVTLLPAEHPIFRMARAVRCSGPGLLIYGPLDRDAQGNNIFDDEELHHMVMMPTATVSGGVLLAGVFLLLIMLLLH
ncbi:hypothetical protein FZI85_16955 [Mycobacterium sp. CBMA293]|uniref:hypothetical protein n=2 Tax=Mycolicibacterium TaxID=1866885 RepID=UPI0012DBDDBA|nr:MULTISPECIES: hypothetical protein [unclassified Mycolicibacterium]MUL44413.1 hypothetical protein [Mycolicibacterium sp. CBMA 360]MUL59733.1 hypothetical protein [Mycolicibacterium sp. CBMA 335]MUL68576.1 hypothetical protein [Mycolicibacterium sp. CBMA 311]MUL94033.1 hypothetical protein [Mycolicibacterium sp. CBMA 230]MUM12707.1 hypothetical protein [Mycolicibacterium sp. CBMA 293]